MWIFINGRRQKKIRVSQVHCEKQKKYLKKRSILSSVCKLCLDNVPWNGLESLNKRPLEFGYLLLYQGAANDYMTDRREPNLRVVVLLRFWDQPMSLQGCCHQQIYIVKSTVVVTTKSRNGLKVLNTRKT